MSNLSQAQASGGQPKSNVLPAQQSAATPIPSPMALRGANSPMGVNRGGKLPGVPPRGAPSGGVKKGPPNGSPYAIPVRKPPTTPTPQSEDCGSPPLPACARPQEDTVDAASVQDDANNAGGGEHSQIEQNARMNMWRQTGTVPEEADADDAQAKSAGVDGDVTENTDGDVEGTRSVAAQSDGVLSGVGRQGEGADHDPQKDVVVDEGIVFRSTDNAVSV